MITVALLGVGLAFIVTMYMQSWRLWVTNYTDLTSQRDGRIAMDLMVQGIRQARPMSVVIDNLAGEAYFSRIRFTHVKEQQWSFFKQGAKLYQCVDGSTGFMCDGVEALQFTYPAFSDYRVMDIGLTLARPSYQGKLARIQLAERVGIRNP
jgi:hypothetical protein